MPIANNAKMLSELEVSDASSSSQTTATTTANSAPLVILDAFRVKYGRQGGPRGWEDQIVPKICRLLDLSPGWDSYKGEPLKLDAGRFAIKILNDIMGPRTPIPQVVPVSTGGIQFEWHKMDYDLELYIAAPYDCELSYRDHTNGDSDSITLSADFSPLARQMVRISH